MACDKRDAAGCYGIGLCFKKKVRNPGEITDAAEREGTIITAMIALGVACEEGVASACMEHADLYENQKTDPSARKSACEFVTRACELGHKAGCADCVICDRTGNP
jgi:TPR repeat protein